MEYFDVVDEPWHKNSGMHRLFCKFPYHLGCKNCVSSIQNLNEVRDRRHPHIYFPVSIRYANGFNGSVHFVCCQNKRSDKWDI